jgi:diguanylate cyclase (GGDEF)-like protein
MSKRLPAIDVDAPSGSVTHLPLSSHAVDPRIVLSSIGEAVYDWDIATDALSWSGNAPALIGVEDAERVATGAGFNTLLDPVSPTTRAEAILLSETKDSGSGVPYRFSFVIRKTPGQSLWFEDSGRWFAGANGRAATAHGVVRRIEAPGEGDHRENPASNFDGLTGAYLRGPFIRLMADDIEKARAVSRTAVLFLVAINDLAFISQSYGFEAADEVIAGVARRVLGVLRRTDRIVRYSNTKLGILLTVFNGEGVEEAAHRIMGAVSAEPIQTSSAAIAVKLQMGCAVAPRDAADPILLLRQAEEALAEARIATDRPFIAYQPDSGKLEAQLQNITASDDVVRALNERRILIALEPVLSAQTRVLQFYEALVRVRTTEGEILGAGAIIPMAERLGLVQFVDIRVLELAIRHLVENPHHRLSVNVSIRTTITSEWMAALSTLAVSHPGVPDRLIIEITETAAMADVEATSIIVERIKTLGMRVAIDDFGSGHTSFRSLRALPVDILKIDGVFVQNLTRSTDDRFFVRTLIDLANHLGVQTVAEWVQDEEAAAMLAEWGVTFVQGEHCGLAMVPAIVNPPELLQATG